jgi:putative ABC transport system permease protein
MPLVVKVRSLVRNLFSSRRVEADLDQEVHAHLEMLIAENIRAGMPPEEARRAALIELGGSEQVKEQVREERLGNWLRSVLSDCRYGLRQLRKNPGATAVMVFTLALAIGATTAIFSVVYGVLLRPLPYTDSSRIMAVFEVNSEGRWAHLADPNFDDFRDQNRSFRRLRSTITTPCLFRGLRSRRARRLPTSRPTFSGFRSPADPREGFQR